MTKSASRRALRPEEIGEPPGVSPRVRPEEIGEPPGVSPRVLPEEIGEPPGVSPRVAFDHRNPRAHAQRLAARWLAETSHLQWTKLHTNV